MSLAAHLRLQLGGLDLDAEIAVAEGEVVAIVGPNGSGKTTVLRALAGLVPLSEGRIVLDGVVLEDPARGVRVPPEHRPVGFVFQDYLLFPHLSALENVAFGLRCRGMAHRPARDRARQWLERVGLAQHSGARPRALSGGQAQRVALARALATDPGLLLLDEPTAALDAGARVELRREIRRHLETFRGTRLLVTHDPLEAATLADRLVVLEAGRVVQSGTPAEVSERPRSKYVAELVGIKNGCSASTSKAAGSGSCSTGTSRSSPRSPRRPSQSFDYGRAKRSGHPSRLRRFRSTRPDRPPHAQSAWMIVPTRSPARALPMLPRFTPLTIWISLRCFAEPMSFSTMRSIGSVLRFRAMSSFASMRPISSASGWSAGSAVYTPSTSST